MRWGGPPTTCPHCGVNGRCYYLRPVDGRSRPTRSGNRSARRIWRCAACRRQFSALTGTVFEGTRISLRAWIDAVDARANGVSVDHAVSREAARHIDRLLDAALAVEPARCCLAELSPG